MWGKGKLLLAAAIIMALVSKATAINPQQIDAAPAAKFPTYLGCRDEAIKRFIQSGLLQQELNKSAEFNTAWTTTPKGCASEMPGWLEEQYTAFKVIREDSGFVPTFNQAVERMSVKTSTYEDQFHFKSFYFLLMDLMRKAPPNQCRTVYMYAETGYSPKNGSSVRFTSFVKPNVDIGEMQDLDGSILLNITTCFFAFMRGNDCMDPVVFSPAEVFTVEDVKSVKDEDDEYTMVVLNHQSVEISMDCFLPSRSPAHDSPQWLVLVLGALFLHLNL